MSGSIVAIETTLGTFKAELFDREMPITVGNFLDLVNNRKFYDGLHVHRVVPNFTVQFGCEYTREYPEIEVPGNDSYNPNAKYNLDDESEDDEPKMGEGMGPPDTTFLGTDGKEYTRDEYGCIEDEFNESKISNGKMTLSMANGGPDTGATQIFINLKDNPKLDWFNGSSDAAHAVFGKVIEGWDVVEAIEKVECYTEKPIKPLQIVSVKVLKQASELKAETKLETAPAPTPAPSIPQTQKSSNKPVVRQDGEYMTLEYLQNCTAEDVNDYVNREQYLEPSVFVEIFGVSKEEFTAFPKWKQTTMKKKHNLF